MTGGGESIQPPFLTAGGGDSGPPGGIESTCPGHRGASQCILCVFSIGLRSLPVYIVSSSPLSPEIISQRKKSKNKNNCQHLSPTRATESETGAQMSSLTALSTLIKRNRCKSDCYDYCNNVTSAQKGLVMAPPDRDAVEQTLCSLLSRFCSSGQGLTLISKFT